MGGKSRKDMIQYSTGTEFGSTTRAAENRIRGKGIVLQSYMVPQQHYKAIG